MASIIDRTNLLWLLRYRFAYALPPAETYYLLIPTGYRLTGRDLLALSQLPTFEEVLQNLPEPFRRLLAPARNTTDVAVILEQEMARTAHSALRHAAFSLARVFAYLVLRETDLRRVRGILRGRHLQLSPDLIRRAVGVAA
jgi:V/A-type H+-transporting ATPase subunit C